MALFGTDLHTDWYVFPAAEGFSKPDPTQQIRGWRSAWRSLTRAVYCPECGQLQNPSSLCSNVECGADISKVKSRIAGLRFHDLRYHAITELAESQTSDSTIMSIVGHVSARMLSHYSHVRIESRRSEAKRKALDALAGPDKTTG
jgi:rubredoxin